MKELRNEIRIRVQSREVKQVNKAVLTKTLVYYVVDGQKLENARGLSQRWPQSGPWALAQASMSHVAP